MARKCDTAKYKRRRAKERHNHNVVHAKKSAADREWERRREEARFQAAAELRLRQLRDPRRPYAHALVRLLDARIRELKKSPLYQLEAVCRILRVF